MPKVTPNSELKLNLGNIDGVGATFDTVNDGDYWESGLASVGSAVITNSVAGVTSGATYGPKGRVTFRVAGGSLTNVKVLAIGYA